MYKLIILIFLQIILFTACERSSQQDYRNKFIGIYDGLKYHSIGYLNPTDTSFWSSIRDTTIKAVQVTTAPCQQCIALIYDTSIIDEIIYINSDTIVIPENGYFEIKSGYIGNEYYNYYIVKFINDSLIVKQYQSSVSHNLTYEFQGTKGID